MQDTSVSAAGAGQPSRALSMPSNRSLDILCAVLLIGCDSETATSPRTVADETQVTAVITSLADVALFAGDGPAVHAQVSVRNDASERVSIIPCSNFIEARLPSSRTWTNIGFATVGLCPNPEKSVAPGASAELGASGSSAEFRALAGRDAPTVLIRAGFVVRGGAEGFIVRSAEYSVTRP
jgi:hypothetical protein